MTMVRSGISSPNIRLEGGNTVNEKKHSKSSTFATDGTTVSWDKLGYVHSTDKKILIIQ